MKLLLKAFDSISNPFTAFFFEDSHYLFHYDTDITVVKCATRMFEAFAEWALCLVMNQLLGYINKVKLTS